MNDFNASVFWPEFKAAGMLETATLIVDAAIRRITSTGAIRKTSTGATRVLAGSVGAGATSAYVGFTMPNRDLFGGGVASSEYAIEYQHADLPTLKAGDQMTITDANGNERGDFRVRQAPFVADEGTASDGHFRRAILTKI